MIRTFLLSSAAALSFAISTPALAEGHAEENAPALTAPKIEYKMWTLHNGLRVIAIEGARAEHEQAKAEPLRFKAARARTDENRVEVAVPVSLPQIGVGGIISPIVFAPDQIMPRVFQAFSDIAEIG